MQKLKIYIVLLVLPLLAFTSIHKFYISVTHVEYSSKNKSIQIISRIFIDDLEDILEERYGVYTKLATKEELENADFYIQKYIEATLQIKLNGKITTFNFIGKEYDVDVIKCYLEIPNIKEKNLKQIEVSNKILFDLFNEQQNITHIKALNSQKSFLFIKENHKGLLNL